MRIMYSGSTSNYDCDNCAYSCLTGARCRFEIDGETYTCTTSTAIEEFYFPEVKEKQPYFRLCSDIPIPLNQLKRKKYNINLKSKYKVLPLLNRKLMNCNIRSRV